MKIYKTSFTQRYDKTLRYNWTCESVGLDTFFSEKFSKYKNENWRDIPLFSFYRDEESRVDIVKHSINYLEHDVNIIISELDCLEHLKNDCVLSPLEKKDPPPCTGKKFIEDEYTIEVFKKLCENPYLLFCYISGSGKGIRIAFELDDSLRNDTEYIANSYYYTKNIFLEYDEQNKMGIDCVCDNRGSAWSMANMANIYWFVPVSEYVYYNKNNIRLPKI